MADKPLCKIDGCGKPAKSRGMCKPHYLKWWHREAALREPRVCSFEGCNSPVAAKNYCHAHYRRLRLYGDPARPDKRFEPPKTCKVDDCNDSASWKEGGKRGYCQKHYARWWKYGDPLILQTAGNGELEEWLRAHVDWNDKQACLIWPYGRCATGYTGSATVAGVSTTAYRQMCILAHGEQPTPDHEVAHSCGKGTDGCVNPHHLRWDTHQGNMDDKIAHGTITKGEDVYFAKLTAGDVRQIRQMARSMMQKDIAPLFGVTRSAIGAILRGKSWAWLE